MTKKPITRSIAAAAVAAALAATGCGSRDTNEWTLDLAAGAAPAGRKALVETARNGRWTVVDTFTTGPDGAYRGSWERPAAPAIMRLVFEGGEPAPVYFPVDSNETVGIDAGRRLSGSASARLMTRVDSLLGTGAHRSAEGRRAIAQAVLECPSSIGAYYTVSRTVDGRLLFDPTDRSDLRLIGAVANAYAVDRPDDPRTAWLGQLFVEGRAATASLPRDTVYAAVTGAFEVTGHDVKGRPASLLATARAARLTILNFASADGAYWPAVNMALKEQARRPGVAVFQMAMGDNEAAWRESAASLPWTSVWASPYSASRTLSSYNVGGLPTTFVLDAEGTVVERVDDMAQLPEAVSRHLR